MDIVEFGGISDTLKCEARNRMTREIIFNVENLIMVNLGKNGKPAADVQPINEYVKDRLT